MSHRRLVTSFVTLLTLVLVNGAFAQTGSITGAATTPTEGRAPGGLRRAFRQGNPAAAR